MTTEANVKSTLVRAMRDVMQGAVIFRHEDRHLFGVPDISCTWAGRTTWWEVKFGAPRFHITEVQLLTCRKLARRGHCAFIIFHGVEPLTTFIIHPEKMAEWTIATSDHLYQCTGFDYRALATYMKGVHHDTMG